MCFTPCALPSCIGWSLLLQWYFNEVRQVLYLIPNHLQTSGALFGFTFFRSTLGGNGRSLKTNAHLFIFTPLSQFVQDSQAGSSVWPSCVIQQYWRYCRSHSVVDSQLDSIGVPIFMGRLVYSQHAWAIVLSGGPYCRVLGVVAFDTPRRQLPAWRFLILIVISMCCKPRSCLDGFH